MTAACRVCGELIRPVGQAPLDAPRQVHRAILSLSAFLHVVREHQAVGQQIDIGMGAMSNYLASLCLESGESDWTKLQQEALEDVKALLDRANFRALDKSLHLTAEVDQQSAAL